MKDKKDEGGAFLAALILFSLIGAIGGAGWGLVSDLPWTHVVGFAMIAAAWGAGVAVVLVALGSGGE